MSHSTVYYQDLAKSKGLLNISGIRLRSTMYPENNIVHLNIVCKKKIKFNINTIMKMFIRSPRKLGRKDAFFNWEKYHKKILLAL